MDRHALTAYTVHCSMLQCIAVHCCVIAVHLITPSIPPALRKRSIAPSFKWNLKVLDSELGGKVTQRSMFNKTKNAWILSKNSGLQRSVENGSKEKREGGAIKENMNRGPLFVQPQNHFSSKMLFVWSFGIPGINTGFPRKKCFFDFTCIFSSYMGIGTKTTIYIRYLSNHGH